RKKILKQQYGKIFLTICLILGAVVLFTSFQSIQAKGNPKPKVYTKPITDGPYVFLEKYNARVYNILSNDLTSVNIPLMGRNIRIINPNGTKTYSIPTKPPSPPKEDFQNVEKFFVVSDIHGQYGRFKTLLLKQKIVNKRMQWKWGKGHLVILGDVFDRGPKVNELLWAIHQLELKAAKKGGKVHYLLGNHELLVLRGDRRYIHAKYLRVADKIMKLPPSQLYGPDTVIGRWLRTKPTIIRINDSLLVHGGIHPKLVEMNLGIKQINDMVRQTIDAEPEAFKADPILSFLFYKNGPFWFRGYFNAKGFEKLDKNTVKHTLEAFNVKRVLVGHTTHKKITPTYDNLVWAIDAGLQYGIHGEGLLYQNGKFYRALDDGSITLFK
ncbi:MAG: hypothetical protein GY765_15930, partial [bacterium]|nr:hypothetical protein [bacterium]